LRDPERTTGIGVSLSGGEKLEVASFLRTNVDMFTWTATDMPGVDPNIIMHTLLVCREARPMTQKKRKLGEEKRHAAKVEAKKLLEAGFIKEAHYTTWLANVVMVKKLNGKWRMCTDYTDLNKACPKDAYPLRLQPNQHAPQGQAENDIHDGRHQLLLRSNVVWVEECRDNISKVNG